MLFYGGIINFVIGLAIVLSYNAWTYNWRVIITIFGWLAILEGLFYMFCPSVASKLIAKIKFGKWLIIYMVILLLLGIFLVFAGFSG